MERLRKMVLSLVLTLSMVLGAFPVPDMTMEVRAETSGSCGDNATWTLADGTLTISGTGEITDAFNTTNFFNNVNKIVIEDGITKIGKDSLDNLNNVTSITIPESVTIIDYGAFSGDSKLKSIIIPSKVTSIGDYAFSDCIRLEEISIPDSVESIGKYAFYKCKIWEVPVLPKVTSIEDYTYYDCDNLINVTISENITSIGENAFYGCSNLESITIPSTVTSIGKDAFKYCDKLTDVFFDGTKEQWESLGYDLPEDVIHYILKEGTWNYSGDWTLYSNGLLNVSGNGIISNRPWWTQLPKIKKIVIGNCITGIGVSAFEGCISLTDVIIPESVKSIGDNAFTSCDFLESIIIPASVTALGSYVFPENLKEIFYKGTREQWDAMGYNLPEGVVLHCMKDMSIWGMDDRGSDGEWVLYDDGLLVISGKGNVSYFKTSMEHRWKAEDVKKAVIEEGVTSISLLLFSECVNMEEIELPLSLTGIGSQAFQSCSKLKSIDIPSKVKTIGSSAFQWCDSLTAINVDPANQYFTSIDGVLYNRSKTKLIKVPATISGNYVVPDSVTDIDKEAFHACKLLTKITIPAGVKTIGEAAFYYCESLTDIIVADENATYLTVDGVLYNKDKTKLLACPGGKKGSFTVPESVNTIEYLAFGRCEGLTEIILPEGLYKIEKSAFRYCTGIESIVLPNELKNIGESAFEYCSKLADVRLPYELEELKYCVFSGTAMTSITIPGYMRKLDWTAFPLCLKDIYYVGDREDWDYIEFSGVLNSPDDNGMDVFVFHFNTKIYNPIKSISLEYESINLQAGQKKWLYYTIEPRYASNQDVTWSSSNENVATVSEYGNVTAVGVGEADITATAVDGGLKASCHVIVGGVSLTGIKLDRTSAVVAIGGNITLKVTYAPENASNKTVSWSSSDDTIARVANGKVTGLKEGKAVIKAVSQDGKHEASCEVTVKKPQDITPEDEELNNQDDVQPDTAKPIKVSENKTTKINDADVTVKVDITYPAAVNWTGKKITKAQLAVLVSDGEIAKVNISGLDKAIKDLNKDVDFKKLISTTYVISKDKNVNTKGSFYVKLKLNAKVAKKAKIKGDNKKALQSMIKELNQKFKDNPYKFDIVPVNLSDSKTVESVVLKAAFKNGELQLKEDGSIKKLKSLKIKVKVPGLKKAKTYTFSAKKAAKSFTIKVTNAAGKKAEVTALAGQNFKGSRKAVDITK